MTSRHCFEGWMSLCATKAVTPYFTYMHLFVGAHDMDRLDALTAAAPAHAIPTIGVGGVWYTAQH